MPRRCSRVLGRRSLFVLAVIVLLTTLCSDWPSSAEVRPAPSPGTRTECDPLIPLRVDLFPTTEPTPGGILQLGVEVWSGLDPDEIRSAHVEYKVPPRLARSLAASQDRDLPLRRGRASRQFSVAVPDRNAYEIRARVVVELRNGGTIAQTAVRWINAGPDYRPPGMTARVVLPDGSGVRVYQGVTSR
jgi:hypothetical protein